MVLPRSEDGGLTTIRFWSYYNLRMVLPRSEDSLTTVYRWWSYHDLILVLLQSEDDGLTTNWGWPYHDLRMVLPRSEDGLVRLLYLGELSSSSTRSDIALNTHTRTHPLINVTTGS